MINMIKKNTQNCGLLIIAINLLTLTAQSQVIKSSQCVFSSAAIITTIRPFSCTDTALSTKAKKLCLFLKIRYSPLYFSSYTFLSQNQTNKSIFNLRRLPVYLMEYLKLWNGVVNLFLVNNSNFQLPPEVWLSQWGWYLCACTETKQHSEDSVAGGRSLEDGQQNH